MNEEDRIRKRLDGMRRDCLRMGRDPEKITFSGVPLRDFTAEDLRLMLAHEMARKYPWCYEGGE